MATSFAAGELYIIGEIDPHTDSDTGFCKIGLVREADGRFSADRLREHQTGNPRRLVLVHALATQMVEKVETALHGLFATRRISGEWFMLTPAERTEVLAAAERLAAEAAVGIGDMRTAAGLAKEESHGKTIQATESVLAAHRRGLSLRLAADRVAKLSQLLRAPLEQSIRRDSGINRFGYINVRKDTTNFDEAAFRQAHGELWERYQKDSIRVVPYFRWQTTEAEVDLSHDLDTFENEALVPLGSPLGDDDLDKIHDLFLRLLGLDASISWELEMVEASIKAECGNASGIDGVCTWRRTMSSKRKLDTTALKADHPTLHGQYTVTKPGATVVNVARGRNFRR